MANFIYFVVMLVLSYALQPKPTKPKPAAFEDFEFPQVDDGTPQIVVFGDVWLTDWTVIGMGNYYNQAITESGGLFSSDITTGYRYGMSLYMGACRGLDDLVEIKVSDKTAWTGNIPSDNKIEFSINQKNLFGGDEGEGGIAGSLTILRGAADQPVLPELAEMYGTVIEEGYYTGIGYYGGEGVWIPPVIEPAVVPAYRGVVTFFYHGLVCSNSPYPKPWSFRVRRSTSNWDGDIWYPAKAVISINNDKIKAMNPAHIIFEAQTNRTWGRGFSSSQLDLASFQAAADQLYSENFGMCLAWRRQESLNEFIQQIVNTIGAALFLDRLTGLWKLVLIRDNYNVETLPIFNSSNGLLNILDDNNAANDVASNQTIVTYRDPITNQDQIIRTENIAAIQKYGVISEKKTYVGIPTAALAGRVAARDMKIAQSSLKKFKLELDRRAYQMQPMSVFKINAPEQGIDSLVLRAIRVEHNDITNGIITITAMQDVFGLAEQNFINSQPSLHQPPNLTAQQLLDPYIVEMPFTELLRGFSVSELQTKSGQGYLSVLAQAPNSLHMSFDIFGKTSAETAFSNLGKAKFVFIGSLASAIGQTATNISCTLKEPINSSFRVGDRAILDNEIVRIEGINTSTNSLVIARGCIDTVPAAHAVNTKFCVYSNTTNTANHAFNSSATVNLKCITRTASDVLNESSAIVFNASLFNRLARPYPPNNVKINDEYYPDQIESDLVVTWVDRNRLHESILSWTDSGVVLENGAATILTIKELDTDDIVVVTHNINATGTNTYTLAMSAVQVETRSIEVTAKTVRDGYESYQYFQHTVELSTFFSAPHHIEYTVSEA